MFMYFSNKSYLLLIDLIKQVVIPTVSPNISFGINTDTLFDVASELLVTIILNFGKELKV